MRGRPGDQRMGGTRRRTCAGSQSVVSFHGGQFCVSFKTSKLLQETGRLLARQAKRQELRQRAIETPATTGMAAVLTKRTAIRQDALIPARHLRRRGGTGRETVRGRRLQRSYRAIRPWDNARLGASSPVPCVSIATLAGDRCRIFSLAWCDRPVFVGHSSAGACMIVPPANWR